MAYFTSEYECKLDTKGRLVLPAKIKSNLPEVSTAELVIRKGFESNLILYPMVEYKKIHHQYSSLNDNNPRARKLKRLFFRSVEPVMMDSANRILLPKSMLAHANLEKEVTLVGMGDYIEIWNPEAFDHSADADENEYSELDQEFFGGE
ncbi:MAG: division/cell wall cluster transcriptional repressor MraZ [Ekhidna sp.]|nr:division/cell wall cluster transcriptional repressor MraZ [Ekhidna sp.]